MPKNKALTQRFRVERPTDSTRPEIACLCCEIKFKPKTKRRQDFCSSKCRLLYWTLNEILKAFGAGKLNGLRGLITKIKEL
jgi:hypothetical protein